MALATWPPGLRISSENGTLPAYAGNFGSSRSVSVALSPTPTTSNKAIAIMVPHGAVLLTNSLGRFVKPAERNVRPQTGVGNSSPRFDRVEPDFRRAQLPRYTAGG